MTDPHFNLREIVKQLVLLEDHLAQPPKFCADCILKHLFAVEAYAEEAVNLGGVDTGLGVQAQLWMRAFVEGVVPESIGQDVRRVRKELAPKAAQPRTATVVGCPHRIT